MPCSVQQGSCACAVASERCDGRHLCECGGSWRGTASRREDILILPTPGPWVEAIAWSETLIKSFGFLIDRLEA